MDNEDLIAESPAHCWMNVAGGVVSLQEWVNKLIEADRDIEGRPSWLETFVPLHPSTYKTKTAPDGSEFLAISTYTTDGFSGFNELSNKWGVLKPDWDFDVTGPPVKHIKVEGDASYLCKSGRFTFKCFNTPLPGFQQMSLAYPHLLITAGSVQHVVGDTFNINHFVYKNGVKLADKYTSLFFENTDTDVEKRKLIYNELGSSLALDLLGYTESAVQDYLSSEDIQRKSPASDVSLVL